MSKTLQQHLLAYIQDYLKRREGAWIAWCDPKGEWEPLLQRLSQQAAANGHDLQLISISEQTAGEFGGPVTRRQLQELIESKQSFIYHMRTDANHLGWLWAQALLAEQIHVASLRQMLSQWGWRPQSISTSDADVARLARQHFNEDPGEWGGGQILPEAGELLKILAGQELYPPNEHGPMSDAERQDKRIVLDITVDAAGLPEIDEQHLGRWRLEALARLLVTQAYQIAPENIGQHDFLIAAEQRQFALKLLHDWQDSMSLRPKLFECVLEADQIVALGSYFSAATFPPDTFVSHAIERALFVNICNRLAQKSGRDLLDDLAPLSETFLQHAQHGLWGDQQSGQVPAQALPWSELARLSNAVVRLLDAAPRTSWPNPTEVIQWYTATGWQVEQAGEEIMRQLNRPTTELLNLITPLREAYTHHWEQYLLQWSNLWSQAGYPVPSYSTQGEWLKEQLKDARPTAVMMIDALRYDIGVALKDLVNRRQGAERATLVPARTALPTVTAVGMAAALPIPEKELQATIMNGKWQVYQQGDDLNLSVAENRREWLKTVLKVPSEALLWLDKKGSAAVPAPKGYRARLFVFDSAIDKLGHDDELEPLGTQQIQERYTVLIDQLHDAGWSRILLVTDHGFIHWPGVGENRLPAPVPEPAYSSRRALAYPASTVLTGPQGLAPGGQWRLAFSASASCFKTYGGLGYFHGGASLQEWIVPCIKVEWPSKAKPVQVSIQPIAQILSLRQKITLEVQHEDLFYNENALTREVELIVRDSQRKRILFRSPRTTVVPNQEQVLLTIEPEDDVEAARGTRVTIELHDVRTNRVLDTQTTVLMVELENW